MEAPKKNEPRQEKDAITVLKERADEASKYRNKLLNMMSQSILRHCASEIDSFKPAFDAAKEAFESGPVDDESSLAKRVVDASIDGIAAADVPNDMKMLVMKEYLQEVKKLFDFTLSDTQLDMLMHPRES